MMIRICFAVLYLLMPAVALAVQANVNLDYNPQKNTDNLIPFSPAELAGSPRRQNGYISPQSAEAKSVRLAGVAVLTALGGSDRSTQFQKGDNGVWTLTVGPLEPDMYIYHFNVDGMQIADPSNTIAGFTAMPPYSQLVVHGDGPAYYDARDVPHGLVTRHVYQLV